LITGSASVEGRVHAGKKSLLAAVRLP